MPNHTENSTTPVELDWRFAELVARTWLEPELAERYGADPCAVLAEFGLSIADPGDAPRLEPVAEFELIIDELDWSAAAGALGCGLPNCGNDAEFVPVPVRRAGLAE
jgi:putative thiazole/oxazole-modified microcin (TOMM)-like peptide